MGTKWTKISVPFLTEGGAQLKDLGISGSDDEYVVKEVYVNLTLITMFHATIGDEDRYTNITFSGGNMITAEITEDELASIMYDHDV